MDTESPSPQLTAFLRSTTRQQGEGSSLSPTCAVVTVPLECGNAVTVKPLPQGSALLEFVKPGCVQPAPVDPVHSVSMFGNLEHKGELNILLGPMRSGKSSALLQRLTLDQVAGHKVLYINSAQDTRKSSNVYSTHNPLLASNQPQLEQLSVSELKQAHERVLEVDAVGVDEAQFFTDLYEMAVLWLKLGKVVTVASLDGDYLRRKFGTVLDLIPLSDSAEKLTALCQCCLRSGRRTQAPFTMRVVDSKETVLVGKEQYVSVCRPCYLLSGGPDLSIRCISPTYVVLTNNKAYSSWDSAVEDIFGPEYKHHSGNFIHNVVTSEGGIELLLDHTCPTSVVYVLYINGARHYATNSLDKMIDAVGCYDELDLWESMEESDAVGWAFVETCTVDGGTLRQTLQQYHSMHSK